MLVPAAPSAFSARLIALRRISFRQATTLCVGVIALLAVLGSIEAYSPHLDAFDLDAERRVPAAWSALLLLAAGACCFRNGSLGAAGASRAWYVPGALFVLMAVDEWLGLHEWLEDRTGVDWQLLYLPLFAVAGVSALLLLRRLRPLGVALHFVGGALCWGASQVLEKVQWSGNDTRAHYSLMMIPEEVLEMGGSMLFLFTALVVVRGVAATLEPIRGAPPLIAAAKVGLPS